MVATYTSHVLLYFRLNLAISAMPNFTHQNLQNRSFKGQNLAGSDFQGADIRGCNFKNAQLNGANFTGAIAGLSRRQKVGLVLLTISVALVSGDAVSRLVFNTISQSPLDKSAEYIPVLAIILSVTSICSALAALQPNTKRGQVARIATATLCGALMGFTIAFFYGLALRDYLTIYELHRPNTIPLELYDAAGRFAAQRSRLAQRGIVIGAIALLLLTRFRHTPAFKVAIAIAGTIVSYGAAFFWGTTAGAFLSTHEFGFGVLLSLVTVFYLGCTTLSLRSIVYQWKNVTGTSFRAADLTNATFKNTDLRHTDFSKAIGYITTDLR